MDDFLLFGAPGSFYNVKNCIHVKLILCKTTKKATMEDEVASFTSSSDG